ncbi:ComF family protein [Burkholderia cepacia]|uniref:ComF family protein n=1 Tax=Burkholderia cepacia TaxID=292 RepID=UPI00398E59E2
MQVNVREIEGNWDGGYSLDKHTLTSVYIGDDEYGHPRFDTTRTEAGEAVYQLKYDDGWDRAEDLAEAIAEYIWPLLPEIGLIVPMPASTVRPRQPVTEVAHALGKLVKTPVFDELLFKRPGGPKLKDLKTKAEKLEALQGRIYYKDRIAGEDSWNVLLLDDLYDTGATAEVACDVLRTYEKIDGIYVAALTRKGKR